MVYMIGITLLPIFRCFLKEHKMLGLRREGLGVVLDSELPYLLAIDDNILSTGMRLYHLKVSEVVSNRGRFITKIPQNPPPPPPKKKKKKN